MAGTGVWIRLLERHRARLTKDPDMNRVVPKLIKRRFFSDIEERQLAGISDASERTDLLLDKLSRDPDAFREFCMTLEECAPHLLTELLLDRGEIFREEGEEADNQALQLGFELALKERDAALRDQARVQEDLVEAHHRLDTLQTERDRALRSLDSLSASKSPSLKAKTSGSSLRSGLDTDDPHLVEESGDNVVWQIHKVTLQRVANYGFGIAVSGGYDSPHFASGDPSVAISDVLKAGPAEGKLQLNDRIISVNGISLENVSHSMAIQVLKNSGDSVHLVVRRRVVMPAALEKESPPLRVTLIKKTKKDDFGLVLGCRFFIQDVLPDSAAHDGGLKVGDTILKVNNTPLEGLSVGEVKKLIDRSKDRLQLIVSKSPHIDDRSRSSASRLRDDEGYSTFRPPHEKDDINLYRPNVRSEEQLYPGESSPGMYPPQGPTHFDARYGYDPDTPPRPAMAGTFPRTQHRNEGPPSPNKETGRAENFYSPVPRRDPDGYYSDHDMEGFRGPPPEDMIARHPHDETDIRRVVFHKDRQKGLGLRLAGGNATGIFIASVQPGSRAEAEGLVEGDQILQANGLDIVGLTREEAVAHLTGLEGQVTLVVQYRKEDYDSIMASHEAGDSFYIRTHFTYQPSGESGDHGFKVGDIFHIKDTLFRGVGGSWLAIRVGPSGEELKKGTIPNRKKAEVLASAQQENSGRDTLPNKGRGSLFKRKSARRAKSLGKDHWEEVIFSGLTTKFPPYERVVLRDPTADEICAEFGLLTLGTARHHAAFVRPVVVFGAIADVARDMLMKEFPDRFESPQVEKGAENDPKKGKTGIIRFGAIREAIDRKKHCVLDVTPYHVDRLNYAQYYPIVIFIKGESKQAIKEVRSRWRGAASSNKNPKKLQELNERMDSLYTHLFTGVITHTLTDVWFPKLVELVQSQQRRPVWMSEKKPDEDFNDDFMFPMPNRLSLAAAPDHELDLARPVDDLDISPTQKKRLVRSSSDPSINTADRVPGIPPYPAPPGYRQEPKLSPYDKGKEEWDDYRHPVSPHERDGDWQMHPDDRYYPHPHHPPQGWSPQYQSSQPPHPHGVRSRSSIDVYATITPSERARKRMPDNDYPSPHEDYGPHLDRLPPNDPYSRSGPRSPHDPHMSPSQPPGDHRVYNDGSSNDNDSYSRYVSSPANKHDDSKLRDKFSSLQIGGGQDRNPGSHDPYRFTRSTANPVGKANIDRVKLSHLTAKYRQEDRQGKPAPSKGGGPVSQPAAPNTASEPGHVTGKKKEPPPVPAKTYSLKEVGMDLEQMKARNYENSNRAYNYSEVHFPGQQPPPPPGNDPRYPHDPNLPPPPAPHTSTSDSPYEYISTRSINPRPARRGEIPPEVPPPPRDDYAFEGGPNPRAFTNSMYMDQREVEQARLGREHGDADPGGYSRPRTDDEQLRDLHNQRHRTRLKSEPTLADRAKSETRLDDRSAARWNKYKSWDYEKEGQRTFDAYKKLITPGFYGNRKNMSKSHDELREEMGEDAAERRPRGPSGARGSAFESYRRVVSGSSLPPSGRTSAPGVVNDDTFSTTTTHKGHITDNSLPAPPLPSPPSRPAFTEMATIPNMPLPPPPPPLPLATLLRASPPRKVKTYEDAQEMATSSQRGPIRRQLSAKERYSHGSERSEGSSGDDLRRKKRSSADFERRRVTGRNARNNSDVGAWMRREEEKPSLGNAEYGLGNSGKELRYGKTLEPLSSGNARPGQNSVAYATSSSFGGVQPYGNDTYGHYSVSSSSQRQNATFLDSTREPVKQPYGNDTYGHYSVSSSSQRQNAMSLDSTREPVKQPYGNDMYGHYSVSSSSQRQNAMSLNSTREPVEDPTASDAYSISEIENVLDADTTSPEFPLPPPPVSDAAQGKIPVSGKLSSEIPLPPPPPAHTELVKNVLAEKASSELPLPPPPPFPMTDAQKLNSSPPDGAPPSKATPPPPPPPPLIITPLPLVNGEGESGEKPGGKMPLKRLSGPNHIPLKEDVNGEESGDGETSESVSTPDTVVAAGPVRTGQEDGQSVVATARGVFTSAGGVLRSEETGVNIVIPEGAIEEGVSQEIYFKVCSGSSILPPLDEDKGETLLSPLVMCGPHGLSFRKPVELQLPHSASVNPHSWSFALKSSDSPSGQPTQWQNMTLAGSEGVAQGHVSKNSVSVLVDHF